VDLTAVGGRLRPDALLFGESAGRIVVSCEPRHVERLLQLAKRHSVPAAVIGRVGGAVLSVVPYLTVPVDDLTTTWQRGLPNALEAATPD